MSAAELSKVLQRELPQKKMTPEEKIASVHIDFDRDNILPELNGSELEKMGVSESKPVLVKANIVQRNSERHFDVIEIADELIGQTLYSPIDVFKGNNDKPYYTFVKPMRISARTGRREYGLVLLDVDASKSAFEVVHWHWIGEAQLVSMKEKMQ